MLGDVELLNETEKRIPFLGYEWNPPLRPAHNPPFPANNTTGKKAQGEENNESNRHRPPGGRFGQNCHPEGNQKNAPHPGGRPAAENIDTDGCLLMGHGEVGGKIGRVINKLVPEQGA